MELLTPTCKSTPKLAKKHINLEKINYTPSNLQSECGCKSKLALANAEIESLKKYVNKLEKINYFQTKKIETYHKLVIDIGRRKEKWLDAFGEILETEIPVTPASKSLNFNLPASNTKSYDMLYKPNDKVGVTKEVKQASKIRTSIIKSKLKKFNLEKELNPDCDNITCISDASERKY